MEPWYSCLDPNLPGFQPLDEEHDDDRDLYEHNGHEYVKAPTKNDILHQKKKENEGLLSGLRAFFETSIDEKKAKGELFVLNRLIVMLCH